MPSHPLFRDTVLAKYIAVSFRHNTGSGFFFDTASQTTVQRITDDSIYRPDTLVVTTLGPDSIRLSGSLISAMPNIHYDFAIDSPANYTYPLSVHSLHQFSFFNGYDSVSSHYWSYSGVSSSQFAQTDTYFNCRKQ